MGGMMGGGGSPSIPQRNPAEELPQIFKGFKQENRRYQNWWQNEDLLNQAHNSALTNLKDADTSANKVTDLTNPLMKDMGRYNDLFESIKNRPDLGKGLEGVLNSQLYPVLNRGGALTDEQKLQADRDSLGAASAAGMAHSNPGLISQFLNRDNQRQSRFGNALSQALSLISGRDQELQGRTGEELAALGGRQGAAGSIAGLFQSARGLVSNAINTATGVEGAQTGNFQKMIGPIWNYFSDLNSSNQSAAADQAIAGANKSSGTAGGILGTIGSIAGAAATAY